MCSTKSFKIEALGAIIVLMIFSCAFAADEQPARGQNMGRGGPQGGMQGGPGGGFDREGMQDRMLSMMQERLGATDAEWTVIKPRLSKVMELSRSSSMRGGMRGMFGRGRNGRDRDNNNNDRQELREDASAVEKASAALEETLEKDAPAATEIKEKLTALRSAREKAKAELVEAQKSLREVLSLKQEAQLVIMGMLD